MKANQSCLIFNPTARGEKARQFRARLHKLGGDCAIFLTTAPGHAQELATQAARDGFRVIIAAGGDGTVNEVVNGIAFAPGGLASVQLGVLPLGTINVFARELGLPLRVEKAWRVIQSGHERRIDLGHAEFGANGHRAKRYFIQLAGAGVDSRAIELVSWNLKKMAGPFAYVVAALKAMGERQPSITAATQISQTGELALIGNGRFYGGSFPFFPGASLSDGQMDVCVLPKLTWLGLARALPELLTGWSGRHTPLRRARGQTVTLTSPDRVILQLDGENAGELPATLTIAPGALRVIAP